MIPSDMIKTVQRLQEELGRLEVEGAAGGGMVTVRVNGQFEVVSVTLDPEVVDPQDIELLQDLIASAIADALRKVRAEHHKKLAGMATGMGMDPGAFLNAPR